MRLLMTDPLLLRSGAAFGGNADAAQVRGCIFAQRCNKKYIAKYENTKSLNYNTKLYLIFDPYIRSVSHCLFRIHAFNHIFYFHLRYFFSANYPSLVCFSAIKQRAQRMLQYHYRFSLQFLAQQHMLDVPVLNALAAASASASASANSNGNGSGSGKNSGGFAGVGQKSVAASPFASLAAVAHDQEPHNLVFAHALSSGWLRSICDRPLVTRHVWVMVCVCVLFQQTANWRFFFFAICVCLCVFFALHFTGGHGFF